MGGSYALASSGPNMAKPKRILLKLSGEMLAGSEGFGVDAATLSSLTADLSAAVADGTEIALVVGGGNFFRGIKASESGIRRVTVDHMGMLATVINALALADYLNVAGTATRVMSAIPMGSVAEVFDREKAREYLRQGSLLIFAAGTGSPYFTTDTAASLRAIEIEADLLAKATKVDGVYDKDPAVHSDAKRYEKISYDQVLADGLGVMDAAAVALCRDNKMPVLVFNLAESGSIARVINGETSGTLMTE